MNKKIVFFNGIEIYFDDASPDLALLVSETFGKQVYNIGSIVVSDKDIVYDVGAAIGDTALYYASFGAKVLAFEPMEDRFEFLKRNILINERLKDRIMLINAVVGEGKEVVGYENFYGLKKYEPKGIMADKLTVKKTLKTVRLDSGLKFVGYDKPTIVKIDVEGYEVEVLLGAGGILRDFKPKILAEIHNIRNLYSFNAILEAFKYQLVAISQPRIFREGGFDLCLTGYWKAD